MRTTLTLCGLALAGTVTAQTPPAAAPQPAGEQRVERLVHTDSQSRVEELRVGGESRRIDVTTRSPIPGYQIIPATANQAADNGLGMRNGNAGRSSWNVLKF